MKKILFNKYEVVKILGEGATGRVYLVKDLHLSRFLAVKCLNIKERSLTEVNALKNFEHPSLPIIYDYRSDDEYSYIIMEYVEGVTLREYMERGRVTFERALEVTFKVCEVLDYLHNLKPEIIYRDLKPENIMIRPDGSIKLIDFGAVLLRSYDNNTEKDNYGTAGYSAPELFKGKTADRRSDIYSVGAILHEMLSGASPVKPPFSRLSLRRYDRSIPRGIENIVNKCLSEDRTKRYPNITELVNALRNYNRVFSLESVSFFIRKFLVIACYIMTLVSFLYPLYKGVPEEDIPLPFLKVPIIFLLCSFLLHYILLYRGRGINQVKIEKDIFLTEKKYLGLLSVMIFLIGALSMLILLKLSDNRVLAVEKNEEMWVNMCDTSERKLLLKDDASYSVEDKVRLEIPEESLPEGESRVQVMVYLDDGRTMSSRVFKVRK